MVSKDKNIEAISWRNISQIVVKRTDQGKLENAVYRKPTNTNKYLSFDSHHPICHRYVPETLFWRV